MEGNHHIVVAENQSPLWTYKHCLDGNQTLRPFAPITEFHWDGKSAIPVPAENGWLADNVMVHVSWHPKAVSFESKSNMEQELFSG
jgi:hypothetical protein